MSETENELVAENFKSFAQTLINQVEDFAKQNPAINSLIPVSSSHGGKFSVKTDAYLCLSIGGCVDRFDEQRGMIREKTLNPDISFDEYIAQNKLLKKFPKDDFQISIFKSLDGEDTYNISYRFLINLERESLLTVRVKTGGKSCYGLSQDDVKDFLNKGLELRLQNLTPKEFCEQIKIFALEKGLVEMGMNSHGMKRVSPREEDRPLFKF